MAIRDKMKEPLANTTKDGKSTKFRAIMGAAGKRGIDDLFLRPDCPCPAADCPHKGNCAACLNYHHMISSNILL